MSIKIANTQAFWGDRIEASSELLRQQPDLDYLTLDYLSEVSLSIMAVQRSKDSSLGYAKDFLDVLRSLIPFWEQGSPVKVVTNAGGLEPLRCATECVEILKKSLHRPIKVGVVYGDDILEVIKNDSSNPLFNHLETQEPISVVLERLTTANAYMGAQSITEALIQGADIVITGRIADPSMVVAPCMAHFRWDWSDYDKLAQATVAGHLIECGTQVTGGISTHWLEISDADKMGYPLVEIDKEANIILMKPKNTSGIINLGTVKEQLLYEIGDPAAYLSPDVTVSFLSLVLEQMEKDTVLIKGAKGKAPSMQYKVSATYHDGYRTEGTLAIFGRRCKEKAKRCGEVILTRMIKSGYAPRKSLIECIGCGDIVPGVQRFGGQDLFEPLECLLRVSIADPRIEVLEYFSKQIAPMVTCGPPGTTGYTTGRPHIRPVFGYWPCLVSRNTVKPKIQLFETLK